jgi:hypothetical protein
VGISNQVINPAIIHNGIGDHGAVGGLGDSGIIGGPGGRGVIGDIGGTEVSCKILFLRRKSSFAIARFMTTYFPFMIDKSIPSAFLYQEW